MYDSLDLEEAAKEFINNDERIKYFGNHVSFFSVLFFFYEKINFLVSML